MRTAVFLIALSTQTAALEQPAQSSAICGLTHAFDHETRHYGERRIYGDSQSLFFTSPMAVNTDGAPNSHHPDDPWGERLALNTICNGANAALPDGRNIDYRNCRELISAFRAAREANWIEQSAPRIKFYGVATSNSQRSIPCVTEGGEFSGYFVSSTALIADASKDDCDQGRYLNSMDIPFAIYPRSPKFKSHDVGAGDVVVYLNKANGAIDYGIIGDQGPRWGLAEGSIAFAQTLRQTTDHPQNRRDTYRYSVAEVHALILPHESLGAPFTAQNVRDRARERFERWGGMERLLACADSVGRQPKN